MEADGTIRTVKYTADKHSGFNAIVLKHGKAIHPTGKRQHRQFTPEIPQIEKPNHRGRISIKPVHPDYSADYYTSGDSQYEVAESSRQLSYAPLEVPYNHKPVYTGINEQADLLALYKDAKEQFQSPNQKFDYGINEYLAKRHKNLIGTVRDEPRTRSSRNKNRKRKHQNRRILRSVYYRHGL